MKFTALLALVALSGSVDAISLEQKAAVRDFNGADEDEIMDKVFSKYSVEGTDHNGVKNGQKILMKSTAPKAAGVILEATHKLKGSQVPGYMKQNFEKAWEKFDINSDGFVKAEETHTFMRSLMGKLNKFALAPGSLSDIGAGAEMAAAPKQAAPVMKKAPVPVAAPKKQALSEEKSEEMSEEDAEISKAVEKELEMAQGKEDEASLVDLVE